MCWHVHALQQESLSCLSGDYFQHWTLCTGESLLQQCNDWHAPAQLMKEYLARGCHVGNYFCPAMSSSIWRLWLNSQYLLARSIHGWLHFWKWDLIIGKTEKITSRIFHYCIPNGLHYLIIWCIWCSRGCLPFIDSSFDSEWLHRLRSDVICPASWWNRESRMLKAAFYHAPILPALFLSPLYTHCTHTVQIPTPIFTVWTCTDCGHQSIWDNGDCQYNASHLERERQKRADILPLLVDVEK